MRHPDTANSADPAFRRGLATCFATYVIWGLLPIYWKMLGAVSSWEILAHRVVWSLVFMGAAVALTGRARRFVSDCRLLLRDRRKGALMLAAAVLIAANWLTFIWAVTNGHVIDAGIGYYINPLVNVALGIVFFREAVTVPRAVSVALAAAGIALLTWHVGALPWIAIALALTFGFYGAVKKKLLMDPFTTITLEAMMLTPAAAAFLFWLGGQGAFGESARMTLLLVATGAVTSVPLVLFSLSANALPLNVLGFIQYIAPTLTVLLGIFLYGEPFEAAQLAALAFIWAGIAVFTAAEVRARRAKAKAVLKNLSKSA